MIALKLFIVALLIFLTAFFVATEFAIVKVRKGKIDTLAANGDRKAAAAQSVLEKLDEFLSACQLGITMTSLGIGWLGEPAIGQLMEVWFFELPLSHGLSMTISTIIAFLLVTVLHVVLGELVAKTFAIQKAEQIVIMCALPLIWFNRIMYPLIWVLNSSANLIAKLFGVRPMSEQEESHTEEELRHLLSESYQSGEINQSEYRYADRIFDFDNRLAKEIMIPRTEVDCLYCQCSMEDNMTIMKKEKFTRYPVAENDKDHIIGLVNIKELFHSDDAYRQSLRPHIRPIISMLETTPIKQLLIKMQKESVHMAVLIDEYGGTSGIVTVEDILEEIVGEIRDEFDIDEAPMIRKTGDDTYEVDGKVLLTDLSELMNVPIYHEEIDTIGGFILSKNPDVQIGTVVQYQGLTFKVQEAEGLQIKWVEIQAAAKEGEKHIENEDADSKK
ncbi:hemolysin family protein [Tuberibacillus sp. Marseille-P3662]|uniref:hemolysin family protein n=1 Tax=Tuberibacillus sp. Marseille-P3662 TaxID=1965358 RepID=UPI000A1CE571|nr:hemolysin family protein [Tuberibacillus sp. Marseille-P3662]